MMYSNIRPALFLRRINRFVAYCDVDGRETPCHVKNTGRLKELLIPGSTVYVNRVDAPNRSTLYDLIAVQKGEAVVNIDSQIPNRVFCEWAQNGGISNLRLIKPERTYGDSRFDFYMEAGEDKIFAEVKGVTLKRQEAALFPDAPTLRGVKHINQLCRWAEEGHRAMVVFIIQMRGARYFAPNDEMHPEFGQALRAAHKLGVEILALECDVSPESISARGRVEVRL